MTMLATDAQWMEWIEVQKAATRTAFEEENPAAAIAELDEYLAGEHPADLTREAVAFRATLHEEAGDLPAAKEDFLLALSFATEPDHVRFELQDCLAATSTKLGEAAQADKWYSAALRTAASDPRVAGGGFLLRFLRLRGERGLSEEELLIAKQVLQQSWHLLGVEGEPDLTNLKASAKKLVEAQRGPFSAERPLAPKAYPGPVNNH